MKAIRNSICLLVLSMLLLPAAGAWANAAPPREPLVEPAAVSTDIPLKPTEAQVPSTTPVAAGQVATATVEPVVQPMVRESSWVPPFAMGALSAVVLMFVAVLVMWGVVNVSQFADRGN